MSLNHPELWQFIFFQEIFHKNSQTIHLYIRNISVNYCHCGPVHFNYKNNFFLGAIILLIFFPRIFVYSELIYGLPVVIDILSISNVERIYFLVICYIMEMIQNSSETSWWTPIQNFVTKLHNVYSLKIPNLAFTIWINISQEIK